MIGTFRTIVVDPPWPHPDSGARVGKHGTWASHNGRRSVVPYPRMTIDQIKQIPVQTLRDPNGSHLYLWTTNRFLRDAFDVLDAWDYRFSTLLTWCKQPMGLGLGGTYATTAEYLMFARHGQCRALRRQDSTWWQLKRPHLPTGGPAHSQKPEHIIDMIEQTSPGPRVELFARRARIGWEYAGNESHNTVQVRGLDLDRAT